MVSVGIVWYNIRLLIHFVSCWRSRSSYGCFLWQYRCRHGPL